MHSELRSLNSVKSCTFSACIFDLQDHPQHNNHCNCMLPI